MTYETHKQLTYNSITDTFEELRILHSIIFIGLDAGPVELNSAH